MRPTPRRRSSFSFSSRIPTIATAVAAAVVPLSFSAAAAAAATRAGDVLEITRILRTGDPFPHRPGEIVFNRGPSTFAAGVPGADGIVPITAPHDTAINDLLLYNLNTGLFEPFAQSGSQTIEGFRIDAFGGVPLIRNAHGVVNTVGPIRDVASGNSSLAIQYVEPDGGVRVAIAVNSSVPGHPIGVFQNNGLIGGSLGGIIYNLNDAGTASFQSRFSLAGTLHMGVYQYAPSAGMQRVIDSTQPVPGQPAGQWVPFVAGSADTSPFDPIKTELTAAGETIFRGRFRIGGTLHRGLYRGSVAGGVTAIVDPARGDPVPGRPAGTTFFSILDGFYANRNGDVAFEAISTGSFARGVYLSRPGQVVQKVRDNTDDIPTVPPGTIQTLVNLHAVNDAGDTLIASTFGAGAAAQTALLLCSPGGATRLIARTDQLAGLPPGSFADFSGPSALNDAGDALTTVTIDGIDRALYAYLAAEDEFVRLFGEGDGFDGMTVQEFEVFAPSSSGGFGPTFSERREFVASLRLRPDVGPDVQGLYHFQVNIPEPAAFAIGALALLARRRAGC